MPASRAIKALALALASSVAIALAGCDGSVGDGEQASPINEQESRSQAQAYQNFAKTKKQGRPAGPPKGQAKDESKATP